MVQGLLDGSDLKVHVRRWVPKTLQEFLQISMNFINEEEGAKSGKEVDTAGLSESYNVKDRKTDWKSGNRSNDNRGTRDPRPRNRHSRYTELNVSMAQILDKCWNTEFLEIKTPKPLPHRPGQRTNKWCRYHRSNGHETNHCNALKDDIEDLIKKGKLSNYVKKPGIPGGEVKEEPRGKGKIQDHSDEETSDHRKSKGNPVMMMISGGLDDGGSLRTLKRKWKELTNVTSVSISQTPTGRPPLSFSDEDFWNGKPNKYVPLIVRAVIANNEVRRLLVDQGSSSDILFEDLIDRMGIDRSELLPYKSSALTGFDGSRIQPIGTLDLMVTYGTEPMVRTIKTNFLIVPCKSIYNGIIGRSTIGKLGAVCSTTHLKIRFHSLCNKIITLESDMESAARTLFLWSKAEQEALRQDGVPPLEQPTSKKSKGKSAEVNATDLDARYDPDSTEEDEDDHLAKELKKKMRRPQPDGDFLEVQLENNPLKIVKIGADLQESA